PGFARSARRFAASPQRSTERLGPGSQTDLRAALWGASSTPHGDAPASGSGPASGPASRGPGFGRSARRFAASSLPALRRFDDSRSAPHREPLSQPADADPDPKVRFPAPPL